MVIKILNRPKPAIQLPVAPSEPLSGSRIFADDGSTDANPEAESAHELESRHKPGPTSRLTPHTPSFDLGLARFSLILEVICYTLIPLVMTPVTFTALAMLGSFGGGFNPAVQALALELFSRRQPKDGDGGFEAGRLFGALSVIQALWCVSFTTRFSSRLILGCTAPRSWDPHYSALRT